MKILWVATKAPWPTVDGGRLLLWNTLAALRRGGVAVTLIAPYLGPPDVLAVCEARMRAICRPILVPSKLPSAFVSLLRSLVARRPWSVVRHVNPQVRHRVEEELGAADPENAPYDVVVAEQLQALAQIPTDTAVPVVLRAQNVESDLWSAFAACAHPLSRGWLTGQARWLAEEEARAVRDSSATVALTDHDAQALRSLAGTGARVEVVPAVVEIDLPGGEALEGEPAVVLFGSAGWKPNAEGARVFVESAWPAIRHRNPGAVLHVFGDLLQPEAIHDAGIRIHPSPEASASALAAGSILAVPLTVASGVRMKILEAWSRGVAVVASPIAARGLEADPGLELSIAEGQDAWAKAVSRTVENYDEQRAAARRRLRETYAADQVAERWLELFETLIES